jgi:16S rRNA (guanine527-N7)-methyltransferase
MTPDELENKISGGCKQLRQIADDEQLRQFAWLLTELARWSVSVNLTAIRDIDDMISGHLLDSLSARPFLQGSSIVDIGTGAGFPGLPLAIAEPDRAFTLLDSNGKKISFVQHVVTKLGLGNVSPVKVRAEEYAPGNSFDTVIARALASVPKIIELGGHLAGEKGVLLALKGKYPAEELEQLERLPERWVWKTEEVSIPGLPQHSRHIIRLKKKAERREASQAL